MSTELDMALFSFWAMLIAYCAGKAQISFTPSKRFVSFKFIHFIDWATKNFLFCNFIDASFCLPSMRVVDSFRDKSWFAWCGRWSYCWKTQLLKVRCYVNETKNDIFAQIRSIIDYFRAKWLYNFVARGSQAECDLYFYRFGIRSYLATMYRQSYNWRHSGWLAVNFSGSTVFAPVLAIKKWSWLEILTAKVLILQKTVK